MVFSKRDLAAHSLGVGGDAPGPKAIEKILRATMRAIRQGGRNAMVQIIMPSERFRGQSMGGYVKLWSGGPTAHVIAAGSRPDMKKESGNERVYLLEIRAGYLLDAFSDIYGDEMKRKVQYEKERQAARGKEVTF